MPDLEVAQAAILDQYEDECQIIKQKAANKPPSSHWNILPPLPPAPNGAHHFCRLFLNHFGYLSFDNKSSFHMIENTQRFQRSVVQLDKTSGYSHLSPILSLSLSLSLSIRSL